MSVAREISLLTSYFVGSVLMLCCYHRSASCERRGVGGGVGGVGGGGGGGRGWWGAGGVGGLAPYRAPCHGRWGKGPRSRRAVSYKHPRAHETKANRVCRLRLEKKKKKKEDEIRA